MPTDDHPSPTPEHARLRELIEKCHRLADLERVREAQALLEEAERAALTHSPTLLGRVYRCQIRCHRTYDEYDKELETALKWWALPHPSPEDRLRCHSALAGSLARVGELQRALDLCYPALAEAERLDDHELLADVLSVNAVILFTLGRMREGCALKERVYALGCDQNPLSAASNLQALTTFLSAIGEEHYNAGDREEAMRHWNRSLALNDELFALTEKEQMPSMMASAWVCLAGTRVRMRELDLASEIVEKGLTYIRSQGFGGQEAALLHTKSAMLDLLGRVEEARAVAEEALDKYIAHGFIWPQAVAAEKWVAELAERTGDIRAALTHWRRCAAMGDEAQLAGAHTRARALEVLHRTEQEKERAETERLRAEILQRENQTLSRTTHKLARLATRDALTGLHNRRHFDALIESCVHKGEPFVLALIDVDHFKRINDQHSHAVGDEVLRQMGRILKRRVRRDDVAARYGGEEFVVIWRNATPGEAACMAESLRSAVEQRDWKRHAPGLRVTASFGVAASAETTGVEPLLALADQRLYAAKHGGRNRVVHE